MNESTAVKRRNLHDAHSVITVVGDMDVKTHPELKEASQVAAAVAVTGRLLQLDLSGVAFMDSSGLKVLLVLRRHLTAAGGCLTVTGLQSQPRDLLVLTGTYALLTHNTQRGEPARSLCECSGHRVPDRAPLRPEAPTPASGMRTALANRTK